MDPISRPDRRRVLQAAAALPLVLPAAPWAQQAYPGKPIRLVVPYQPGGAVDGAARVVGQKLGEALGQPVVIDNRPGGNTLIGTAAVAKAPADGYTLLMTASTHVINAVVMSKLPYDSFRDFTPVATVIKSDFVLVAHPELPVASLRELVAYAKANPGRLSYATSGAGNSNHLAAELFAQLTGTQLHHIPYKGAAGAMTDLLAGRIQLMFSVPINVLPHVAAGKLRALATTAAEPLPGVAPIPSFAQAGLPAFELDSWQGILAPAGTPKAAIDRLAAELGRVLAMPDVQARLLGQGQKPFATTTEQFAALIQSDIALYTRVARAANIRVEE